MSKIANLWSTFRRNKSAVFGLIISAIIIFVAVFANLIAPYDPMEQNVFTRLNLPDAQHLSGTDEYGRDVLSRIIWATRISLLVGFFSLLIGLIIGTSIGVIAGYIGGKLELIIMRMVDVFLSFPTLITGIMVAAILGSGIIKLIIAIGIVFIPRFARMAYGPTLSVKEKDYISSSKVVGAGHFRILYKHILPNIVGDIVVAGSLWLGTAIMTETSLSFLGLGVSPPNPTWGNMIRSGIDQLGYAPWLSISPGLAILITVLAFNMIGDGLRDITDPKLRG
jgi:peptide/nickel transport system permease protein